MKSFSELTLSPVLQANLLKHGFKQPTPVQELAIEPALAGRNVVATAQTGTGKTLAFVLPLVQSLLAERAPKGVRAVILSPTRELAIQIHETFVKLAHGTGIRAAVVVGGVGENPQLQAIRKGAQVVVATPGRLYDFLSRQLVNLNTVQILVLDEADRMLDMGFLPTIKRIMSSTPATRQTLFFSATIETSVRHLVEANVPNAVRVEVGSSTRPVEQVDLRLYEIEPNQKLPLLESMLQTETGSFLVFARTKHGADRLAKQLAKSGAKTATIHGDRSQNQRNQALKGFQDGYYRVLVATDVAARGIHVEGISHVVNYDLPQVARRLHPSRGTHRPRRRPWYRIDLRYAHGAFGDRPHRARAYRPHDSPSGAQRSCGREPDHGAGS
ncbi:MAG: DEAD/DEAH box helicase [Ignavibacteriota bacterium]